MLYLIFELSDQLYAIGSNEIVEIIPNVELTTIPKSPDYLKGVFNYRGAMVPVIDMSVMTGGPNTSDKLSTKIMIVNYNPVKNVEKILGLMSENIIGTEFIDDSLITESGVDLDDAKYLGNIAVMDKKSIQLITTNKLLTKDAEKILFSAK